VPVGSCRCSSGSRSADRRIDRDVLATSILCGFVKAVMELASDLL
jgi:hypothetical protein